MAGKRGLGWAGLGTMAFLGSFLLHGCLFPTCACSEGREEFTMVVADGNGPVDSAQVSAYLIDGTPIDTALPDWDYVGAGTHVVFRQEDKRHFPAGASDLEIRVVARKGAKIGEEKITLRLDADRWGLRKVTGRDTITMR